MTIRERIQNTGEFLVGIFSLLFSNLISVFFLKLLFDEKLPDFQFIYWRTYIAIVALSFTIVSLCFTTHLNLTKRSRPMETAAALRDCALTYGIIAVMLVITKNEIMQARYFLLIGFLLFCIMSLVGRYILKKLLFRYVSTSRYSTIAGVITNVERGEKFIPELIEDWSVNVKAVALVDTVCENGIYKQYKTYSENGSVTVKSELTPINDIAGVPVVANRSNLIGWIKTASLDEVYINLPYSSNSNETSKLIEELEDMGIVVNINLPSLENIVENSKFDNINCAVKANLPMAVFSPAVFKDTDLIIKRIFDILGGIVGTIISLPIILITAVPLLIESPGPLIFKQQRVGKNGRIFNIYKLRSMYADAEERKQALMKKNKMDGYMFKMDNDPRITKVGRVIRKLSIDELPQFWNVLKGDMSLVGTRPPTIDEFEKYESHHKRRLSLKPGITGMWQVSGRSDIQNFDEVVKLDCEYIDNWSFWLDIKILFKTVWVVLTHRGAE